MGLFRVILLGVIVWLVYGFYKRFRQNALEHQKDRIQEKEQEKVVQCRTCGVYVPEQEAVKVGDVTYCSEEHRLTDQQNNQEG